jgi:hypothetical protein
MKAAKYLAVGLASLSLAAAPVAYAATAGFDLEMNTSPATDLNGHTVNTGSRVAISNGIATFPYVQPNTVSYGLAQLITLPDAADDSLDPGTSNVTVELRYRTTHAFGNIVQKGQATDPGGQFKMQQPKGKLTCMFKTPTGTATAGSGSKLLNDGLWHDIQCVRTTLSVTMYVDGVKTGRSNHANGNLNNTAPWSIGGKPSCDGTKVTCDYFAGDIDYVRMIKG